MRNLERRQQENQLLVQVLPAVMKNSPAWIFGPISTPVLALASSHGMIASCAWCEHETECGHCFTQIFFFRRYGKNERSAHSLDLVNVFPMSFPDQGWKLGGMKDGLDCFFQV
jgi:hypothetical protein